MIPDLVEVTTTVDATFHLNAAQAAIRRFCRWHVAPSITETVRVAGSGHTLTLPTGHLTALDEVRIPARDLTIDPTALAWDETGSVVWAAGTFPCLPGSVEVTMQHGFDLDDVPDVQELLLTLARRAGSHPGIITQQSVNGASVSYATGGGAPLSVPLLVSEKDLLAPYRIGWRL